MSRTEKAVAELKEKGFDAKAIMDALCDGAALESMGLTDEDQEDIESAYADISLQYIS